MKKNKYISPEVEVHALEAENMMALSAFNNGKASSDFEVLTNENDDTFSNIWGD